MQSNPKKVLHSLKECLLRIALVHPSVSFKIVDIESEDDLLCTCASPSPLPLLYSGFGVQASCSLNKLSASDGSLKLSGYISGPQDVYTVKAFQYFYINSRFVSKGPIHKLLNNLAMSFGSIPDIEKRSKSQICPLFLLNLNCPRSCYDLTLEPSKISVEFQDWSPILFFIEDAVTNLWSGSKFANIPVNCEIGKKRGRGDSCKASLEVPSPQPKKLAAECSVRREIQPLEKIWGHSSEKHDSESRFLSQTECSNQSIDGSIAHSTVAINREFRTSLQTTSCNVFSTGDDFMDNKLDTTSSSGYKLGCMLASGWGDESPTIVAGRSAEDAWFRESLGFDDTSPVTNDRRKHFMQSSPLHRSLIHNGASFASDEDIEFKSNDNRINQIPFEDGDSFEFEVVEHVNQVVNQRSPMAKEILFPNFSRCTTQSSALQVSKFISRYSENASLNRDLLDNDNYILDFVKQTKKHGSSQLSFGAEFCHLLPDPLVGTRFQDFDHYIAEDGIETSIKYKGGVTYNNFENVEQNGLGTDKINVVKEDCLFPSSARFSSDLKFYAWFGDDMSSLRGRDPHYVYNSGPTEFYHDGADLSHIHSHGEGNLNNYSIPSHQTMPSLKVDRESRRRIDAGNHCKRNDLIRKTKRSHSAPPFYLGKKKFFATSDSSKKAAGSTDLKTVHDWPLFPDSRTVKKLQHCAEAICSELPQQSSHECDLSSIPSCVHGVLLNGRPDVKSKLANIWNSKLQGTNTQNVESEEINENLDAGTKWRDNYAEATSGSGAEDHKNQDNILNVTSGMLNFVGGSLVPDTIDKSCLESAKVLQQIDKKFIPIVAGTTLALIDQHAADERIRLEELREKVLSGEMKTTAYLDSEQELVMPEIGYQLLHNYAKQIQNWGWICNIHSQASRSFTRNLDLIHKQPTVVTLLAVPCILGVNLTDVDLLEFLQQLADTDGSSIIPPSVNRILNNKACRSAIMFGDALLPSECSLIVEELKQTSLCFQCAHGRPTTVPLINLNALREQIAKLGSWNGGPCEAWHGLHRHEISLERAAQRLRSVVA